MGKIGLARLREYLVCLFHAAGMNRENAEAMTDVYIRATRRGVGHHDVNDIPHRLKNYMDGKVNINPAIQLLDKYEAMERYDGDNGPGELCSCHIMERAVELADAYGISFCTIKNSNHFLSSAPYIEKAAEKGFIAMIFTRTNPAMHAPGSSRKVIGSSPMGFAAETQEGYPILLDICLAYASYGLLQAKMEAGEEVPAYWGLDSAGCPSTNPGAIANGGVASPIAGHKGFGLSILTEILTGVLSGGELIDERRPEHTNGFGVYSQAAIVLKADGFMPQETFTERTSEMIHRMQKLHPEIRIPGQGSHANKRKLEEEGCVEIKAEVVDSINRLAAALGMNPLIMEG